MLTLPEVMSRREQAYAFIRFTVRMDQIQDPAMEGFPALFSHLAQSSITPAGAPFYNYRRINMADTLDIEAGVPVSTMGQDTDTIHFGTLPGGNFASLTWIGHPDKLEPATAVLIGWSRLLQLSLDVTERPDGDHFACRLEIYETDPDDEPDMNKWVTHLAFKLKD